jgi:hypothetical protein
VDSLATTRRHSLHAVLSQAAWVTAGSTKVPCPDTTINSHRSSSEPYGSL